jgi:hypothetical protein
MAQSLEAKIVVLGSQGVGKTSLVSTSVLAPTLRARNAFMLIILILICSKGAEICKKSVCSSKYNKHCRSQFPDKEGR